MEREARDREALLADGRIEWPEAVEWVLESWSLPALFQSLGPRADVLPAGLRLDPLTLQLPAYLVAALRVQSRIDPMPHRRVRPQTFDEYMLDLLHRALDPQTVEALRGDEELLRAYHFPGEPDDE